MKTIDNNPKLCTACGGNLVTLPGETGAASASSCVAPPGYGFNATTGTATICPTGTYNPGYNREACVPCGSGTLTSAAGSNSSGDCYVPPGDYIEVGTDGVTFTGKTCPADTYGRDGNTFGLVASECTKCPEFSGTNGTTGAQTSAQCLTLPGYGWYDGSVLKCTYGYYSAGFSQSECTFCGEGFNTTDNAGVATAGIEGATSGGTCAVAAGYYALLAGAVAQCPRGQYKAIIGATPCLGCPASTTTTIVSGATARSDCDACDPGYGVATTGTLNLASPSCTICASGTYAPGFVKGGEACSACPKPELFNQAADIMVSRLVRARARRKRASIE
jgi:hypothetical protein